MVQKVRDLRHFKVHQLPRNQLQTFNDKKGKVSLRRVLLPYWQEYCDNSSVHCMRYLTDSKMQNYEKAIWFLIILATSVGAICVYISLAHLYHTQRIQTTVANSVQPIFFITFPSIAICPRNRIHWPRLQQAHQRFLPTNVSAETISIFRSFFESLEDLRFGKFKSLAEVVGANTIEPHRLQLIDAVDITSVMHHLALTCNEMFVESSCYWREHNYDCCKLFKLQRTEIGYCYIFNSLTDNKSLLRERLLKDRYYPFHNEKFGEKTGIEVEIRLNKSNLSPGFHRTSGIYFMAKQPQQWSNDVQFINSNTYTKIPVTAQHTITDESVRSIGTDVRKCLFQDENNDPMYKVIPGLDYWRGNCRTRCHQEFILHYCNCTISLFLPWTKVDNFTECKPSDFECIYKYEKIFSTERHVFESHFIEVLQNESMVCNCLNSCNQLLYDYTVNSVPLEGINTTDNVRFIHLDIHYQKSTYIEYSTRMRYTFVELLANFGGIIGLFLGASLLSAVELGYFLTIGLYTHLRKHYDTRTSQSKQQHVVQWQRKLVTSKNMDLLLNEGLRKY